MALASHQSGSQLTQASLMKSIPKHLLIAIVAAMTGMFLTQSELFARSIPDQATSVPIFHAAAPSDSATSSESKTTQQSVATTATNSTPQIACSGKTSARNVIDVDATGPDNTRIAGTNIASKPDADSETSYDSTSEGPSESGVSDSKLGNAFTRTITSVISIFATR